jgi:hypothetical protein
MSVHSQSKRRTLYLNVEPAVSATASRVAPVSTGPLLPNGEPLNTFGRDILAWGKAYSLEKVKHLAALPPQRQFEMNEKSDRDYSYTAWDINHKSSIKKNVSALIFIVGEEQVGDNRCSFCEEGTRRFPSCVSVPENFKKRFREECATCGANGKGHDFSFRPGELGVLI